MDALSVIFVAGPQVHGLFLDQCSLQNTAYPEIEAAALSTEQMQIPLVQRNREAETEACIYLKEHTGTV